MELMQTDVGLMFCGVLVLSLWWVVKKITSGFPHVPMSKRQQETKSFEICPVFTAGDRCSSHAPFSLNVALRYVNVRPLKQLFLSLTGSDCTNKSQYTENV